MAYRRFAALAVVLGLALAGCSGMQGSGMTPSAPGVPAQTDDAVPAAEPMNASPEAETPASEKPSEQPATASQPASAPAGKRRNPVNASAIDAVNALSAPLKTYNDETASEPGSDASRKDDIKPAVRSGKGNCHRGIEFYSPDKAGDANSSEKLDYYNPSCTQLARDAVRKWTAGSTAGTETVVKTITNYAQGSATPISVKTENTTFSSATFGAFGFPVVAKGYQRETSGQLSVGTRKNVLSDSESVMAASTTNVNSYCTDAAGYNALGIAKLQLTFGWQGGAFSGGTRTANADGSVTWAATHAGQTESAPIGGMSIATGTLNAACPITTPAYTLTGGTSKGNYSIPISVTYYHGIIRNLTVTGATLASGYTLNVKTNASKWPANQGFINGTVTSGTTTIAIFNVNAYGYGKLTVAATGNQFPIQDWNVIR
ncbi:MAG TPA: hypothetical protein VK760_03595 [Candidatus Acidoferrales bacterium]|jgi:hypothetical protein|nr:hypothetical protein [Candidatus Acidoferrales bacterium]